MTAVNESEIPKNARDMFEKGRAAMERGNLEYAMDMFMAVLEIEQRFLKAHQFLLAASIKRFNESGSGRMTHIAASISSFPVLILGWLALKKGNTAKALQAGKQLLRKDPLFFPFIKLMCTAAEAADLPEVAIHTLTVAREHYPENPAILNWLGRLYTASDQLDEAQKCFEAVVTLRPHDTMAMRSLKDAMARDSMAKGGWREAGKTGSSYRDIMKDKKGAAILEHEGKEVKDEESIELLIQESLDKLEEQPKDMNSRRALVNLYARASRFDDALQTLEHGREFAPAGDPSLDQLVSSIHLQKFDYEIAKHRENNDTAGASAKEAEKRAFHFEDIRSRVERYPNDLALRYDYGVLLYENDKINEAVQQFQIAQSHPQRHVQSLYYIGMCFKKKQQFDMAREQLEKAASECTKMNDLKKDIYYELGAVLEAAGNYEQAVSKYYKEIYQVDISYKDIAAKIEKAYKQET